ncbi:CCR4-NOT transcriptional complex subunit CAF120 [Talaromyces islandicus]|uniref:CCR4-NOT transcriptional complex subunit CAF120 n=1 Tax=Talaromyces islandicus TaxID=28573 RepID=A0A0U1M5R3_TALIS|nr:CCR4-NOT transcriptional complex subunit CAF120 [Talaromyces islandicus]
MVRSRVLSFISAFAPKSNNNNNQGAAASSDSNLSSLAVSNSSTARLENHEPAPLRISPNPSRTAPPASDRSSTMRPASMAFTYQAPQTDIARDTLPELLPVFSFLNTQSNKLYQEGYFLKLNDLDTHGRPCGDRKWVECFAQLVGTVLSFWDANALDAAGQDGEVAPSFINLADASLKMIETLPTRDKSSKPLQNVLSISTAGRNRYLFHFNSFHSLTQWTAAIRLSLFEHTALLEAYTGSIIAGKGKELNNIRMIMERCRFKHEDWARVRFGAGTPWRRCWCVVTPPDEKEYQKVQKSMKKRSAYDRTTPVLTGTIKFYETKKTKKVQPIATISDAYAAYAIYPQSKPLIDQSTLVKIEGSVTIHGPNQTKTEGFIFIMPELHPAVSGFEIMLRFLFPVFDTFGLYGRPTRLIADTNNIKSLMLAFPKKNRYGYLDVLDVANLINTAGSQNWTEKEWRRQLREATGQRMSTVNSPASSISGGRSRQRSSLPGRRGSTRFQEPVKPWSSEFNQSADAIIETSNAPVAASPGQAYVHTRAVSDSSAFLMSNSPIEPSSQDLPAPEPPIHGVAFGVRPETRQSNGSSSGPEPLVRESEDIVSPDLSPNGPPAPVAVPPAFAHQPGEIPASRPKTSVEIRRANNRMSISTLTQLAEVRGMHGASPDSSESRQDSYPTNYNSQDSTPLTEISDHVTDTGPIKQQPLPTAPVQSQAISPVPSRPASQVLNLQIDTSRATKRKPLPPQAAIVTPGSYRAPDQSSTYDPVSATSDQSFRDLRHTVDEAALERVLPRQIYTPPQRTNTEIISSVRLDEESNYGDESPSPSYASTRKSTDTKRSEVSIPRPRMGVLKTVGDAPPEKQEVTIGDARFFANQEQPKENPDIPTVDFGPTMVHSLHTRTPSMSDVLGQFGHGRSDSELTARNENAMPSHTRKPSRSPAGEDKRRSVIWQPGMAAAPPDSPGNRAMTPEQFVHQRSGSSPRITPAYLAAARPRSGDWTLSAHQRSSSRDLPPRPHSRGSAMMLNQNDMPHRPHSRSPTMMLHQNDMPPRPHSRGSTMLLNPIEGPQRPTSRGSSMLLNQNDLSSHLSAREQEHVARMTGQSFFNFSNSNGKSNARQQNVGSGGLIGAIDAREREKRSMKEGLSNQMVQQAIAQRQHQQMYETQQAHARVRSIYNMPGANYTWDTASSMNYGNHPSSHVAQQSWSSNPQMVHTPPAAQAPPPYFHQYQSY